jgi:hypothetical protein
MYSIVDASDYEWLTQWTWGVRKMGTNYYAQTTASLNGKSVWVQMQRVILGLTGDDRGDHKNGD